MKPTRIKKHLLISLVIILLGILLMGCGYDIKRTDKVSQYNHIKHHVVNKEKGINLKMIASYNEGKMKIVLLNRGSTKLCLGKGYLLEKQKDGKWYKAKFTNNKGFNSIGVKIRPNGSFTEIPRLKMPTGNYRVIKQLSSTCGKNDDDVTIGDTFTVQ